MCAEERFNLFDQKNSVFLPNLIQTTNYSLKNIRKTIRYISYFFIFSNNLICKLLNYLQFKDYIDSFSACTPITKRAKACSTVNKVPGSRCKNSRNYETKEHWKEFHMKVCVYCVQYLFLWFQFCHCIS